MVCSDCNLEAFINNSQIVVTGDNENQETKVFYEYEYICRNPNCKNFNKKIGTELTPTEFVSR